MIYSVRHVTTFGYEPAVRESVMEVRLHPRSDGDQRCLNFTLTVDPPARVMQYHDFAGNIVHHFDIAGTHSQLKVTAQSAVEVQEVLAPRAMICPAFRATVHLQPEMGHTSGTRSAAEIALRPRMCRYCVTMDGGSRKC